MSYKINASFIKAVRFIHNSIDQPIKLEDIAQSTNMSVSSLKRLFVKASGQTPGAFIRRLKMEYAFRSLQSHEDAIFEVALNSGFQDQSAFARRFKKTFGFSPRRTVKKLNILSELDSIKLAEPVIVELNDLSIQSVTEKGLYFEAAPKAFNLLKSKLTANELDDNSTYIYIGIGHDNPHEGKIKEDQVRFSSAVIFIERDLGIEHLILSGGTYARFHYYGKPNNLGLAYHYIYGKWPAISSLKIDKAKTAFMMFDKFPDAIKEHNILIHVPLVPDE